MIKTKYPFPDWPAFGVPSYIVTDGSSVFERRAFVEACKKLIAEMPQPHRRSLPEDD
jgi:hypothetical protein